MRAAHKPAHTFAAGSNDGTKRFGLEFESMVRRNANLKAGVIVECVFQEGKAFETSIKRSADPLAFYAAISRWRNLMPEELRGNSRKGMAPASIIFKHDDDH